jgi:hypothetical protein
MVAAPKGRNRATPAELSCNPLRNRRATARTQLLLLHDAGGNGRRNMGATSHHPCPQLRCQLGCRQNRRTARFWQQESSRSPQRQRGHPIHGSKGCRSWQGPGVCKDLSWRMIPCNSPVKAFTGPRRLPDPRGVGSTSRHTSRRHPEAVISCQNPALKLT